MRRIRRLLNIHRISMHRNLWLRNIRKKWMQQMPRLRRFRENLQNSRLHSSRAVAEAEVLHHSIIHRAVDHLCGRLHREAESARILDREHHLQQVQVLTIRESIFHVQPEVMLLHQRPVRLLSRSTVHPQDITL